MLLEKRSIVDIVEENIQQYARATFERAFPLWADGLKPVARRILYTMWEDNITSFKKVAFVVGNVMGRYHPHGDMAISDALVKLAQPFTLNYPLIDGQGNFGSQAGDESAAPRYIECKLSSFARDVLTSDIDEMSIDYTENYDYTRREPVFLPSKLPLVLVEGSSGIGEAFTVNIPSHNIHDVVKMCKMYIDNPEVHLKELTKGIFPDYPTGGEIINGDEVTALYSEGTPCSIKLRATVTIDAENNMIIINDLPHGVMYNNIKQAVVDRVAAGKNLVFTEILHMHENNPKKGSKHTKTQYEVICKKDANLVEILNALFAETSLSVSKPVSFMANFGEKVKTVTIKDIIENWYLIRSASKRRKFIYDIAEQQRKKHIYDGVLMVYERLDDVIKTIRSTKGGRQDTIEALVKKFGFTLVQARGIYEMPLGTISNFSQLELTKTVQSCVDKISSYTKDLDNIPSIIKRELEEIATKYARPRQTKVIMSIKKEKADLTVSRGFVLASRNSVAFFTADEVLRGKNILNGMRSVKIEKRSVKEIIGTTQLFGQAIGCIVTQDNGSVKRIELKDVGILNTWHEVADEGTFITSATPFYSEEDEILVTSNNGSKVKRFSVSEVTGRRAVSISAAVESAANVTGITEVVLTDVKANMLRFSLEEVPLVSRGSLGVNLPFTDTVCAITPVTEESDTLVIASVDTRDDSGYIVSIPTNSVKSSKRGNKPRAIVMYPEVYSVFGVSAISTADKTSQVIMLGKNSVSTLNVKHFKRHNDFKRTGMIVVGSYIIR